MSFRRATCLSLLFASALASTAQAATVRSEKVRIRIGRAA